MAIQQAAQEPPAGALRPRAARRPRTAAKGVRGLPDMPIMRDLAAVYLTEQRRHWPKLAQFGFLPDPADAEAVTAMAETFRNRHTTGQLPDLDPALLKQGLKLAASYSRYSCDNSSPSSVADQVVNELRKAKEEGRFIPWAYCLADYAVSRRRAGTKMTARPCCLRALTITRAELVANSDRACRSTSLTRTSIRTHRL